MARFYDMHCHVDFANDPGALAAGLAQRDVHCFSVTVTPEGYEQAQQRLAASDNVCVGVGLHPWWVAAKDAGKAALEQFQMLAQATRFIGEVGLDFSARHVCTRDAQMMAFEQIAGRCASTGNNVLSVHAVRAADAVLDVLEDAQVMERNHVILHWFSGTSDELQRAVELGCFFSIGPRMVATKRGRAYVQAIPLDRLLLETDEPSAAGSVGSADDMYRALEHTLIEIAALRKVEPGELAACMAHTSAMLLGESA